MRSRLLPYAASVQAFPASLLALLCFTLPTTLRADTIDAFTLDEGGGYVYTFALNASPTGLATSNAGGFTIQNVRVNDHQNNSFYTEQVAFGTSGGLDQFLIGEQVWINSLNNDGYSAYNNGEAGSQYTYSVTVNKRKQQQALFSGTPSSPTFTIGVYALKGFSFDSTLTISQASVAVPEPGGPGASAIAMALVKLSGMIWKGRRRTADYAG